MKIKSFPQWARESGAWTMFNTILAATAIGAIMWTILLPEAGVDTTPTTNDADIVRITNILDVEPPLATAWDICIDPNTKVGYFPLDDHYEAQLIQNEGDLNEVRYHLFFREDRNLAIIIEESRAGQILEPRTDPNTQQFWDCIDSKDIMTVESHP